MNYISNPERKRIMEQVLDATTLTEVKAATTVLDEWMALHPDDQGMEDGYEQLALMKEGLLSEVEHATSPALLAKVFLTRCWRR